MSHTSRPQNRAGTLVLGGAGFAGSHIARELRAHGRNVSTADLRPSGTGVAHTLLDVRDEKALSAAVRGCDTVVNVAGVPDSSSVSARTLNSVLVGGARCLIAAAEREDVRTLVLVSSGAVYGEMRDGESADELTPVAPTTAEGRAFAEAERLYGQWVSAGKGRRLLILRAAELFGPGSHARVSRVIGSLVNSGKVSLTHTVIARPLASVGTLATATRAALELNPPAGKPYVLNVADSPRLDDRELRALVRSVAKTAPLAISLPGRRLMARAGRAGEAVRASGLELPRRLKRFALDARPSAELSNAKLNALLPERPSLEAELRETVRWVREHGVPSDPSLGTPIAERFVPEQCEEEDLRRVVAVVVTYNRADLLEACLDALHSQTRPLDGVVIVDNASTDRSGAVADEHAIDADVVHLNRNVGGAGGFCAGMAHALLEHSPDFLWIMDDDTVPSPDALANLLEVERKLDVHASVLSSLAVWSDGRPHPMNSSRTRLGTSDADLDRYAQVGARPIRTASFVSALIAAEDVWEHGLPIADYFIWSDDFEYTGRLLRDSHGFAVASSTVEHRTVKFSNAQTNPGSRFYFDVRNRLWALMKTDSFTPIEKVLYGGKSAIGWLRTLVCTRGDVLPVAIKGVRKGLFTSPRRSSDVVSADPMSATEIRALEASIDRAERSRRALT